MKTKAILTIGAALAFVACQQPRQQEVTRTEVLDIPVCEVTTPPDSLGLNPFYKKYVDVNGIALISSWRVPDSAFVAAHRTLYSMTSMLPKNVLDSMVNRGTRVAIMARYEGTTDIPEHHYLRHGTELGPTCPWPGRRPELAADELRRGERAGLPDRQVPRRGYSHS